MTVATEEGTATQALTPPEELIPTLARTAWRPNPYGRPREAAVGRFIEHNATAPMLRRSRLTKRIPAVKLRELLRSPHVRPLSARNVMNTCVVQGYELPVGARINIARTAPRSRAGS